MVRRADALEQHGFFRLLTSGGGGDEPRLIDTAAEALLIGVADPLGYLASDGDDWTITAAVVQRARELRAERRSDELRGLARLIGSEIAQLFR